MNLLNQIMSYDKSKITNQQVRYSEKTLNFIKKATKIHFNKYDYSKVEYQKSNIKICIICKEHGEFWQTPNTHLRGRSCPKCARLRTIEGHKLNTEDFKIKANLVHNNFYNYDKSEYKGCEEFIIITCPIHGDFEQKAFHHLRGNGCRLCGINSSNKSKELTINEFIERANKVHHNIYMFMIKLYTQI